MIFTELWMKHFAVFVTKILGGRGLQRLSKNQHNFSCMMN